jgi:hypothetical protein
MFDLYLAFAFGRGNREVTLKGLIISGGILVVTDKFMIFPPTNSCANILLGDVSQGYLFTISSPLLVAVYFGWA